ncbi:MAG: hypothetical protein HY207_08765 [Nitrospirae bacterium]|nr:hypothetical protein [Nitrospirota bacterium]
MGTVAEEEPQLVEERSVDLFDYLNVVWRYRWMISGGTLAIMAIVGAIDLSLPRSYQASLLLKVGSMFVAGKGTGADADALVLIEDPQTIAQVLTSDGMVLKLKESLGLDQTDVSSLKDALSIKAIKSESDPAGSTLMELRLTLDNPKLVIDGLHVLARHLIEEHRPRYEAGVALIDRESQSMREKIAVNRLRRESAQQKTAEMGRSVKVEARFREELVANITKLTAELVQIRSSLAKSKSSDAILFRGVLQSLDANLSDLKVERNRSRLRTQEWEVQIRNLEDEQVGLDDQMADLQGRIAELAAYRVRLGNTMIRSEPVLPTIPMGPGVKREVAVAGLVGGMAVIVLAFFIEYLRNARRRVLDERTLMELQQS